MAPSATTEAKVAALSTADQTELTRAIDRTLSAKSVGIDITNESAPGTPDAAVDTSWSVLELANDYVTMIQRTVVGDASKDEQIGSVPQQWRHQRWMQLTKPIAGLASDAPFLLTLG